MILIISTGFASVNKARCIESVRWQDFDLDSFRHVYIEASEQTPPKPAMQNLWESVMPLAPDTIVAHLDGDDELGRIDALAIVAKAYEDPSVWMTYGSQRVVDSHGSHADHRRQLLDDVPEREQDCPSHLKTYRAGLFQAAHRYPAHELMRTHKAMRGGSYPDVDSWRDYYRCGAELYAMLEMCGPEHRRYIPEVLVNYRYDLSENKRMTAAENEQEQIELREVKAMPRRARCEGRPW